MRTTDGSARSIDVTGLTNVSTPAPASEGMGVAKAVVLARSDNFADSLAATPMVVRKGGPLLLTPPTHLDSSVRSEIRRILAPGRTVYLLGGTAALSPSTADDLRADGYNVVRLAGTNRFSTAVAIANTGLGNPARQFLATTTTRSPTSSSTAARPPFRRRWGTPSRPP